VTKNLFSHAVLLPFALSLRSRLRAFDVHQLWASEVRQGRDATVSSVTVWLTLFIVNDKGE
jgi:hypothetical protein